MNILDIIEELGDEKEDYTEDEIKKIIKIIKNKNGYNKNGECRKMFIKFVSHKGLNENILYFNDEMFIVVEEKFFEKCPD